MDKNEDTYVDPKSYETADQALFAVTNEMDPQNIKLAEEIGEGVCTHICMYIDKLLCHMCFICTTGEFGKVYRGFWKIKKPYLPIAVKTLKVSDHKYMYMSLYIS